MNQVYSDNIGYQLSDPHNFAAKMDRVLKYNLSLDRYATASELDIKIEDEEDKVEETKTEEKVEQSSDVNIGDYINTDYVKVDDLKVEKVEEVKHDDL